MSWLSLLPVVATLFAEAPASVPPADPVVDVPSVAAPPAAYPAPPPAGAPLSAPVPASTVSPAIEGGLAAGQVLLGSLTAFGFVYGGARWLFTDGELFLVSVALAPAAGAGLICAMGHLSPSYDGGCGSSMIGGYLGALVAGAGLGILFYDRSPEYDSYGDSFNSKRLAFIGGAALGIIVGTGIGATIGWHLGKHRRRQRDAGVAVGLSAPPLPPPAALADWPELRARTPAPAGGAVVGIPILALRF
jgi:hypothetical protein